MARRHFPPKGSTAVWAAALRKAAMAPDREGRKRIDRLAERLFELAEHGEAPAALAAAREIGDRLDGKAAPAPPPAGEDEPTRVVYTWGEAIASEPAKG
jgi:hypothetical protein